MILGISEDYTSQTVLDTQLREIPDSGLYLNSGVHPSITIDNLLRFLPNITITFEDWNSGTTYAKYLDSRNYSDVVTVGGKIYQSILASNLNQNPATATTYWLETNIDSLRIKNLLANVQERVYSDLNLTKRLVENQYLYEDGDNSFTLPSDYSAWILEPKGSDYVSFRINQISIQKTGTTPINVYIINKGILKKTVQIAPVNGGLNFVSVDETLIGKGKWIIAIDGGADMLIGDGSIDPLQFNGFTVYLANGTGATPESSAYDKTYQGNGIGINISAFFDGKQYIENNLVDLGYYVRATFEYFVFQMFLHNSNNVSSREQRVQMDKELLIAELKNLEIDSVVRRYIHSKRKASNAIKRSFDSQLLGSDSNDIIIETGSI